MTEQRLTFSQAVELVKATGIDYKELAELAVLSPSAITMFRKGTASPTISTAHRLKRVLSKLLDHPFTIDELFPEDSPEQSTGPPE